ncbi:MAG: glycerol kinase GlpK [Bacteriovoracaceae bacterium]|nr:glycerol kinase GlpK [Bacteriovoracaceae bacterium]
MKRYILSIDQGTTGSTALLLDSKSFAVVDKVNHEFPQIFPKPGQVEHNLNDIFDSIRRCVLDVLKKANVNGEQIECIGITNQRETVCAYDRDGRPLCNAIVWQDRRTAEYCAQNRKSYEKFKDKTGLPLDPYFSGTKMRWILDHCEQAKDALIEGNLLLSNIDAFLLYKLTGGKSFKTEPSNASRTLLMDLDTTEWSDELCEFFDVPKTTLPEINDSFGEFGQTKGLDFLPDGIKISCILGDQQAALFGQAGFKEGELKTTYGTGAFIVLNTGANKIKSSNGLLTTIAFRHKGETKYALEGSSYIAGAAVQWLRDNLKIIKNASEIEALASKADDDGMEHVMFLPFFTGIGSPYWNSDAKAAIIGLSRDTNNTHIARATLEGMALSINDSIQALLADSPTKVNSIKVDGGACQNDLLMQIQANFSNIPIVRPSIIETTAYGVALGALVGIDQLEMGQIEDLWKEDRVFNVEKRSYFTAKQKQWKDYISRVF